MNILDNFRQYLQRRTKKTIFLNDMISIWISCGGLWCLTRDDENRRACLYSTREEMGCFFDLPTTVPCPTLYMRQYSRVWLYTKNARFLSYRCVLENTLYQGLEIRSCMCIFVLACFRLQLRRRLKKIW